MDIVERLRRPEMKAPKFLNGDIVILDPVGDGKGLTGKIVGVVHNIDGTFGYMISYVSFGGVSPVQRVTVAEEEIRLRDNK